LNEDQVDVYITLDKHYMCQRWNCYFGNKKQFEDTMCHVGNSVIQYLQNCRAYKPIQL